MSYRKNSWIEELPNPWHDDCRGKFKVDEYRFDANTIKVYPIGQNNALEEIRKRLQESGKLDFFKNNDIDVGKSFKLATIYRAMSDEYSIYVFVDLPRELRVLYELTFTE